MSDGGPEFPAIGCGDIAFFQYGNGDGVGYTEAFHTQGSFRAARNGPPEFWEVYSGRDKVPNDGTGCPLGTSGQGSYFRPVPFFCGQQMHDLVGVLINVRARPCTH